MNTQQQATEYYLRAVGGTAGMNSAKFWVCGTCGACIMEQGGDIARRIHTAWHNGEED